MEIDDLKREIEMWRNFFVDEMLESNLKYARPADKNRLRKYFRDIPSDCFMDPWEEWSRCVRKLLEYYRMEEGKPPEE